MKKAGKKFFCSSFLCFAFVIKIFMDKCELAVNWVEADRFSSFDDAFNCKSCGPPFSIHHKSIFCGRLSVKNAIKKTGIF